MQFETLIKLATSRILFDLKKPISKKLVPLFYFLGLATIVLMAISHIFYTFRFGFGNGLWGLIEVAVFGAFAIIALRIVSDFINVYFSAVNKARAEQKPIFSNKQNSSFTRNDQDDLLNDVAAAIDDLVDEEEASELSANSVSFGSIAIDNPTAGAPDRINIKPADHKFSG